MGNKIVYFVLTLSVIATGIALAMVTPAPRTFAYTQTEAPNTCTLPPLNTDVWDYFSSTQKADISAFRPSVLMGNAAKTTFILVTADVDQNSEPGQGLNFYNLSENNGHGVFYRTNNYQMYTLTSGDLVADTAPGTSGTAYAGEHYLQYYPCVYFADRPYYEPEDGPNMAYSITKRYPTSGEIFTQGNIGNPDTPSGQCDGLFCEQINFVISIFTTLISGVTTAINAVLDAVIALGDFVIDGIAALWLPSENAYEDYFTAVSTLFNDKMGFLSFPFAILLDMFGLFTNDFSECPLSDSNCAPINASTACQYNFGAVPIFGNSQYSLDVCMVEENFPTLWTIARVVIQGITIVALCIALQRKYLEVSKA